MDNRAAIVFARREDGAILAVSRGIGIDQWGMPGGRAEDGESFADCARRELFEETGLILYRPRHIYTARSPGDFITAAFVGVLTGELMARSKEGDVRWLPPAALLDPSLSPFVDYTREVFARMNVPLTSQLDIGVADVHAPAAIGPQKKRTRSLMAELKAKDRKKLTPSQFADPANKAYPIHDKKHADNAAARLEGQKGSMSTSKYNTIKSRITAAQKRFGEKPKTAAAMRPPTKGLRMSVTHPDGTHIDVRHMAAIYRDETADTAACLFTACALDPEEALRLDDKGRVWIQIAKSGDWKGHPQGPFKLNPQIFSQIVKNFREQSASRIHIDFEHTSERAKDPTAVAINGDPAQGWIHDLKIDGPNLFAYVEWSDLAAKYIRDGQYKDVSPAIYWNTKDRVSGQPVGALLHSVALVKDPFLAGMKPLAASFGAAVELAADDDVTTLGASSYAYSTAEYMPKIKAALKLADGATPMECSDHFTRMRARFNDANGSYDAMHDGRQLGEYALPLRDLGATHLGSTWEDVFDTVEEMIEAAIAEHNAIYHPDGPGEIDIDPDASTAASATTPETTEEPPSTEDTTTMATNDTNDPKILLASAQQEVQTLSARVSGLEADLKATKEENARLLSWKGEQEKKAIDARVTEAIETYGDKKGLSAESRGWLTTLCTNAPTEFEDKYPHVEPSKRHLLQRFTADGRTPTAPGVAPRAAADAPVTPVTPAADAPVMGIRELSLQIARERRIPLSQAQDIAFRMTRQRKTG
jgi:8-oxo-dGTP pyrophosphatase MutT (NUDIX family)